jgi:hypothetical protein
MMLCPPNSYHGVMSCNILIINWAVFRLGFGIKKQQETSSTRTECYTKDLSLSQLQ